MPDLTPVAFSGDALEDDDLQLSLYICFEMHYRGFAGVADDLEWDPALIGFRRSLEAAFVEALDEAVPRPPAAKPEEVGAALFAMAEADDHPSLAKHLGSTGTLEQFREYVIHRSAYELKEADPHSWAIPRLEGVPKAALMEVQYDEYGSGRPERIHAQLWADTMRALDLDPSYGAYLDVLPARTLATVNLISLFGLNRSRNGAVAGHLAIFEMTSSEPCRRLSNALRRLDRDAATEFFDEHVEADSVHENIAAYDLAQGLAIQRPELTADILFGAAAALEVEGRWASSVLEDWEEGPLVPPGGRGRVPTP